MKKNNNSSSCLIIGGGITGLIAANTLQKKNIKVTILDKGRGIGGRLATRRLQHTTGGEGIFDYGAQYFSVSSPQFKSWVDEWLRQGIIKKWSDNFASVNSEIKSQPKARYCGVVSNRSIAKYLAQNLDVHTSTKVVRLNWHNFQWKVITENNRHFHSDYLLMTPPLPQSLALLQKSNIVLPPDLQSSLEKITYNKCLAVLAYGEKPSHVPAPGGLHLTGEPLAWLACNQQKGISPQATAITLHAGKEFSENNWENDEQTIVNELLSFAAPWLGSSVVKYQLHRWRYSQPSQIYPKPYVALTEPALILAGDAFMAPKIEGAFLSGLAAAEYLLNKLS